MSNAAKKFLALLIWALIAWASPSPLAFAGNAKISCEPLAPLIEEVFTCGENAIAARRAEECRQLVMRDWKEASDSLAALMRKAGMGSDSSQNNSLLNMSGDFHASIGTLDQEIESMSRNTDLVASYLSILLRYHPGISNPADPHCHSRAEKQISEIVQFLRGEIKSAKALKAKTIGMLQTTKGYSKGLNGDLPLPKPAKATMAGKQIPLPKAARKPSAKPSSNITGTQKAIEAERKSQKAIQKK